MTIVSGKAARRSAMASPTNQVATALSTLLIVTERIRPAMIRYCVADEDDLAFPIGPHRPCPACGATVSGNDRVSGVCQARFGKRREPTLFFTLVDKESGETVASQPVL